MKVLNVAEKNDAAKNISAILSKGTATNNSGLSKYNRVYRFTCELPHLGGHCDMTMTSVSGHLMELEFDQNYNNWNTTQPSMLFEAPVRERIPQANKTGEQIKKTIEREAKYSQALIIWTDGDREGENIGFEIIRVCCSVNRNLKILRAKFSEITPRAMNIAIMNLVEPDENLSKAVDIRRELDLRFGAIFTRYQTLLLQRVGHSQGGDKKLIVSYGPCQFPTMGFVINRYLEILRFKAQMFWYISADFKRDNLSVSFNWKRHRLFDESACLAFYSKVMECPKAHVKSVVGKQKSHWRPEPMHTTSMEKLASQKLRISAKTALNVAEKLYTQGYISYPRTETNIFPKGLNLSNVVSQQVNNQKWGGFAKKILDQGGPTPRQGKKTDNAHPPIHPTKAGDGLSGLEASLYELITRHFLACVSKDAIGVETTVLIDINGEEFSTCGLIILEQNFLEVYIYSRWNAKEIPKFSPNEEFVPNSIMMNEGKTSPPQLLTESDLIALMEKHGIGTDATQAEHIDKVQQRNYVKLLPGVKRFCPTKLGLALYDGYHAMQFTHLIKPDLRARLEMDLDKIAQSVRESRGVAREYIDEHKNIYEKVDREHQKLVSAFIANKDKDEPEIILKRAHPNQY